MPREETPAEWQQHEETIRTLAEAHGGMTGQTVELDDFEARARKLWFWQVPKG